MASVSASTPRTLGRQRPSNAAIAAALEHIAALLEQQQANPYRIQAYRTAAVSVRAEPESLAERATMEGVDGLERLYGVGPRIARHIDTYVHTGRIPLLEQLEGEVDPEGLLTSVPGTGPKPAREIHLNLDINSLEDLKLATHDGRLEQLPGFGPRRVAGLRHTLGNMLSRRRGQPRPAPSAQQRPPVALLLELDEGYRTQAAAGHLPTLAPRRFNPERTAWLPILHTEREGWSFALAYSNTARAHQQSAQETGSSSTTSTTAPPGNTPWLPKQAARYEIAVWYAAARLSACASTASALPRRAQAVKRGRPSPRLDLGWPRCGSVVDVV